ncbi:MAG: Rrf2 family transcriptional regulator [Chloroflexi bacterium]|nr:Rrf2 family transcriptional regulator [Chloroflexota bacterium]
MRISAKAEYATRAVSHLTLVWPGLAQISDIAEREDIPAKFLEAILLELKRASIVASKRGVGGGYCLARSPETITLANVIRVFDDSLGPVGGIERMRSGDGLTDAEFCLRKTWLGLASLIAERLEGVTFADVAEERRVNATMATQTVTNGTAWF